MSTHPNICSKWHNTENVLGKTMPRSAIFEVLPTVY
jgi:hypothetical protein